MIHLFRTDSANADFQKLVVFLDSDLSVRDGEDHAFYAQFNKIQAIKHVVVAYQDEIAVGCGAIKEYEPGTMEVKRMYVTEDKRGAGIATTVLKELETWAAEMGNKKCILETGIRQPEAIALYKKNNYSITSNYGQYTGVEDSVCFEKTLK